MKTIYKLAAIFVMLIMINMTAMAAPVTPKVTTTPAQNAVDLWQPPLYLFVSNPTSVVWCCDGHGDYEFYTTLSVRVTDIHFSNWKGVPVSIEIGKYGYKETKNTNSNGEAIFAIESVGHYEYGEHMPIKIIATSPKSGRYVRYVRSYVMDMTDTT